MKLSPKTAPGRSNRKARAYTAEIARLCRDGYGNAAIQEALAEVGVHVSQSTVQREVARAARQPPLAATRVSTTAAQLASQRPTPSQAIAAPALEDKSLSNRGIAEEFVRGRINNPFVRSREKP